MRWRTDHKKANLFITIQTEAYKNIIQFIGHHIIMFQNWIAFMNDDTVISPVYHTLIN